MKMQVLLLTVIIVAVGLILWSKSRVPAEPVTPPAVEADSDGTPASTVLLFADPREADQSCGCAEVVRLVRAAGDQPGVAVREIDSRKPGNEAHRYEVRVSPSVVILDTSGQVTGRFEGESSATIKALQSGLEALRPVAGSSSER